MIWGASSYLSEPDLPQLAMHGGTESLRLVHDPSGTLYLPRLAVS